MARTFIGELILRLKDEMSGQAQTAAGKLDTSIEKIQAAARKLNQTSWGGRFEQQLQELGASARDVDKLREAWARLNTEISSRNLSKALAGNERTNFKLAALSEFAAIKAGWDKHASDIEARSRTMGKRMEMALKPVLVALGGYTGVYMAGVAGREGFTASSAWEREKFRGRMANIPAEEQNKLLDASEQLGGKYPSVNITDIAEMARSARAMMGDTERGLAILPDLVKGLVTLQSAKGTDAAVSELRNLLRGIDNAGKNQGGPEGIKYTQDIIAGMIRAAQIEGSDLDVGKLFQFARRGKIAVPGLSTKFLATTSPAFMQDMTPEGFGTALSSAYQAFVIGSNAVASKKNIAEQERIGIRDDSGLKGASLFGTDPYAWVKQYLVPALQNDKVDMADNTAIAQSIAKLTRNTNASGLLTRMVEQQQQTDRLVEQYNAAMGPEAADEARVKDPFVAWKGFIESLRNLAAALGEDTMPTIVAGLNSLTNGINSLQQAWRDGDPMAKGGILAGAGVAAFGTWKIMGAIWGLITAGTSLNAAAVQLQIAAASLSGQGVLGDVTKPGKGGIWSKISGLAPWATTLAGRASPWLAAATTAYQGLNAVPHDGYASALRYNPNLMIDMENQRRHDAQFPGGFEGGMHRAFSGSGPKPVDYSQSVNEAQQAGQEIQSALSVQAMPNVNTAQIQAALALANQLKATLASIGAAAAAAKASVANEMRRNFADHGVTP